MQTLSDAFVIEQARVREVLGQYKALGRAGVFGTIVIEELVCRADKSALEQDTVAMLDIFRELQAVK